MLESCSETGAQSLPFCATRLGFDSKCNLCASLEHKTIRCAFRVHFIVIPNADQGLPRHLAAPPFQFSFWFLLTVSLVCFCQYACLFKPSPPKTFSPKMRSALKCAYFVTNEAYVAWRRADWLGQRSKTPRCAARNARDAPEFFDLVSATLCAFKCLHVDCTLWVGGFSSGGQK